MFVMQKREIRKQNREAYILLIFLKVNCQHKHLLNSDSSAEINENVKLSPCHLKSESCEGIAAEMLSTIAKDE